MFKSRKKNNEINLLPVDVFSASIIGKILKWMLSTFRFIVILVELVVMGAFLSRFWLDAKNSDLNDEIKQKQMLIEASANFEKEYNKTNEKINIYKSISKLNQYPESLLDDIPLLLPKTIKVSSLIVNDNGITLSADTISTDDINQFVANLESRDLYKNANITQFQTDDEGKITFQINIPIKK